MFTNISAATDFYINRRDATGSISVNQWFNKDKTITLNARLGYSHDFKGGHHVDAFIAYEQRNTIILVFLPIVQIIYQQLFRNLRRKRCS